jgi:hypothetical protein
MPAQTRNAKRQHNSALLGDLICHDDILESILKIGAPQMSVHRALKSRLKVSRSVLHRTRSCSVSFRGRSVAIDNMSPVAALFASMMRAAAPLVDAFLREKSSCLATTVERLRTLGTAAERCELR